MLRNLAAALVTLAFAAPAFADDIPAVAFLKANVLKKPVVTQITVLLDNGKVRTDFSNRFQIDNLVSTETGYSWTEVDDIKQSRQDVGPDGQPTGPVLKSDRIITTHCGVRAHAWSPSRLLGHCDNLSNTFMDPVGSGSDVVVELTADGLVMTHTSPIPGDCYAAGGGWKACLSVYVNAWSVVAGKTQMAAESISYDADPVSFAQGAKLSDSKYVFTAD